MTQRPRLAKQPDLQPHQEAAWFRETWRSAVSFRPAGYARNRSAATAIYFLLCPGEESAWHAVRSDELWLWHCGATLTLRLGGSAAQPAEAGVVRLDADVSHGEQPQAVVPGGTWPSAAPAGQNPVLVSCVVAPGFDFADFLLG
ncbi:MAG: cupin domain-containing protein [Streptosporangiaceae bacterium]